MHDLTTFEQRLAGRLALEYGEVGPHDPSAIAAAAIGTRGIRDRLLLRFGLAGALPLPAVQRRAIQVMVIAALALAVVALAVGLGRPSGGQLALVRSNGDVVVANADGSAPRIVGNVPVSPLRTVVSWAPDGKHLASLGDDQRLTLVDLTGVVTYQVQLEDLASQFAWSPDGQRLAIFDGAWLPDEGEQGPPRVHPHLSLVAPDGSLARDVPLPDDFRFVMGSGELSWSPDGRRLAVSGYLDGEERGQFPSSIFIVDIDAQTVRKLGLGSAEEDDYHPRWLRDGQILVSRLGSGLVLLDPDTGAEEVAFDATSINDVPEPSPDGKRVVVVARDIGLAIVDLATGVATPVAFPEGGWPPLGWTSDGRALVARWGEPKPGEPFFPTSVATFDLATGKLTVIAKDVIAYSLR